MTSLDVRENGIQGEGAIQLGDAVLESKSMKTFSLIPMEKLRNNEVTELNLQGKGLGRTEARVIGGLLAVNGSVTNLK